VPLLSIIQAIADEVGLPRPNAVATSTEQLGRQFFSLANAELRELSKAYAWPVLQREHSFFTVADQDTYDLPADFRSLIGDTLYNSTAYYKLKGSVSPQEWQYTRGLNLGSLSRARVRISGFPQKLRITPTPVAAEQVVFEYLTTSLAVTSEGEGIAKFTNDTDSPMVDEGLLSMGIKWRIKHAKGLDYGADLMEYNTTVAREYARAVAAPAIQIGGSSLGDAPELTDGYTRENGFG
jgi:hypothetical protein